MIQLIARVDGRSNTREGSTVKIGHRHEQSSYL